jgi:hypothetical protein
VARRQPRLTSIASVLRELGRQYRRADQGELPWLDCSAAARVLREARHCLEGADIERRLAALERELDQQQRPNGGTSKFVGHAHR